MGQITSRVKQGLEQKSRQRPSQVAPQLISGADLVTRWNSEKAGRHNFMPYIEAVHLGPLPRTAFKRAFLVQKEDNEFHSAPKSSEAADSGEPDFFGTKCDKIGLQEACK
jgi:hypothetical protein